MKRFNPKIAFVSLIFIFSSQLKTNKLPPQEAAKSQQRKQNLPTNKPSKLERLYDGLWYGFELGDFFAAGFASGYYTEKYKTIKTLRDAGKMVLVVTGIESVFICINELKKAQRLSSLLKKDPDLDLQKAIEKKENPSNLKKIFSAVVRIVGASFGTEKSAFEKNTYIIGKHPDYLPAYKDKIQPEARGNCFLNGATEGTAKLLITQGATMLLTKSQENASIKEKLQSSGKLKAEYDTLCALTKTGTTIPEFLSNQVASQTYQDLLEKTQQNALEKKQPYRWAGMNIIDKIAKSFLRNSFSISHTRTPGIMSALSPIKMKLSQTVGKFIYGGTSSDAKE